MTIWLPDLSQATGPLYVRLADHIEADIASGALAAGAKLPPQRDLAYDLGVTIGTVGRAYALARERGLVSGEVGRGTYVLERGAATAAGFDPSPLGGTRGTVVPAGKVRMDSTAAPDVGQSARIEELTRQILREKPEEIASYTRSFPAEWMEAGRRWLAVGGWRPEVENVVPALGAHAALLAVISAMTGPGDKVVFEPLTYSSIARSANLIGRRSLVAAADAEGIVPDEFDRLCAQQHPKLAFLVPTLQNPTLAIMSEERRRQLVRVARKHNVWLVEDAIYAAMMDDKPVAIAELAPERTFFVNSLSKTVAAGIRGGWVACPPNYASRVITAHKMVTGGIPFLLADLSAQLVLSGDAATLRERVQSEVATRVELAGKVFSGLDFASHPAAPFLWMKLPEPWLSGTFRNAALGEDVLIDDEDEFKTGRSEKTYHRVRIGFSAPSSRETVESAFSKLRRLLDAGAASYDSYG